MTAQGYKPELKIRMQFMVSTIRYLPIIPSITFSLPSRLERWSRYWCWLTTLGRLEIGNWDSALSLISPRMQLQLCYHWVFLHTCITLWCALHHRLRPLETACQKPELLSNCSALCCLVIKNAFVSYHLEWPFLFRLATISQRAQCCRTLFLCSIGCTRQCFLYSAIASGLRK